MATPKIKVAKIAELVPDPRNARTHSDEQVLQIANSIRRFGWTNPILSDEVIRAGHGRLAAAKLIYEAGERIHMAPGPERGGAELPDQSVPVIDCTGWTDEERRAYALADNQLALNAGWDEAILAEELELLKGLDFDIALTGFSIDPIAQPRQPGPLEDSTFQHVDQYGIIVKCADAAEQEARFNQLKEMYGAENVKVVVV